MTRLIHDQFAKDYLELLLESFGLVRAPRRVSGEPMEIDVWFQPARDELAGLEALGCLGRMAATLSFFEPFRNAVSPDEIAGCLLKWLLVREEFKRQARRDRSSRTPLGEPKLWVLSPTISSAVIEAFRGIPDPNELPGFYQLGDFWQAGVVAIHQLPPVTETLWLRVLGRDRVQQQAIAELEALPVDHPFRQAALELLYNLQRNLRSRTDLEESDREFIVRLEPLYQQERERLEQAAKLEGKQEGKLEGKREVALNLLRMGLSVEQVARGTGLSREQIQQLPADPENS